MDKHRPANVVAVNRDPVVKLLNRFAMATTTMRYVVFQIGVFAGEETKALFSERDVVLMLWR